MQGMLELLDAEVTADASVGEWKIQSKFRLKNIDKLLLKAFSDIKGESENEEKPHQVKTKSKDIDLVMPKKTSSDGSFKSYGSVDSLGEPSKKIKQAKPKANKPPAKKMSSCSSSSD